MKQKRLWFAAMIFCGAALLAAGGFVFTGGRQTATAAGYCVGVGAALTALGAGWLADSFLISVQETAALRRIKKIEVNDERNVRIREKAGAMTAKVMNYVLMVFLVIISLTGAPAHVVVMAACLIGAEFVLVLYFSNYYEKRM